MKESHLAGTEGWTSRKGVCSQKTRETCRCLDKEAGAGGDGVPGEGFCGCSEGGGRRRQLPTRRGFGFTKPPRRTAEWTGGPAWWA